MSAINIFKTVLLLVVFSLTACNGSNNAGGDDSQVGDGESGFTGQQRIITPTQPAEIDLSCDEAIYPGPAWVQCEAQGTMDVQQATTEPLTNPDFLIQILTRSGIDFVDTLMSYINDPTRLAGLTLSSFAGLPLVGDPYRYPTSPGPNGASFYENEADVIEVLFYDRNCARLPGKVWRPLHLPDDQRLPAIVYNNGSIVGIQEIYYWIVQPLVRAGYLVMTFDQRGQGNADFIAADGSLGTNINPEIFWMNLVDAIDFLNSSPDAPYPQDLSCEGATPSDMNRFNPHHQVLDPDRLGVAGHSFGAAGATIAQSFGAPGAEPWPGLLVTENPIDVIVAHDALGRPDSPVNANATALFPGGANAAGPIDLLLQIPYPAIVPRVPALDMPSDYGAIPLPHLRPDKDNYLQSFHYWQSFDQPVMTVIPYASTHTQYSPVPFISGASWCAAGEEQVCDSGWATQMATHYTVAWFDRWLKQAAEQGYENADIRLLDDGNDLTGAVNMSWHYRSARDFPNRTGGRQLCMDIRAGCDR